MTTTTANATFFRVLINPQGNKDIFIIESEILGYKDNTVYAKFLFDVLKGKSEQYKFEAQHSYMHDTPEEAFKFILHNHFDKLVNSKVWLFAKYFGGGVGVDFKEMIAMTKNMAGLKHLDLEKRLREMQSESTSSQKSTQQKPQQQQYDSLKSEEVQAQPITSPNNQKTYTAAELLDDNLMPLGNVALCVAGPLKDIYVTRGKSGSLLRCDKDSNNARDLHFGPNVLQSQFVMMKKNKKFKKSSLKDALAWFEEGGEIKVEYKGTERFIKRGENPNEITFRSRGNKGTSAPDNGVLFSLDELLTANFYVLSE
ncbi:hypothetical protein M3Y14_34125 (plasmid) [Bacillus thuringiensis]|uniref:hypothetical protein n=1 Tax=Bacillus thuringiensis TaxID=1428 RepID=UPI0022247DA5|nr:hypothetical protein [Bacillus thuringiensis]UYX56287.1 hypothetical protein M3Y14_34125 [Bacillus thuringiensis]